MTLTKKKWMALLVAMTMFFSAVGLGLSTSVASAATKAPKKIYLKATSKRVDIKGKVVVSVSSVSPKSASKSVTWKSSNKRIATVSSKGTVTGKRSGKVKITATSKKNKRVKKSITITVKNLKPKVSGLPSKATVYSGTKKTLKAKVGPTGVYNKGIAWKSSNASVASVSSKGVVTAKKKGFATITAYSKESKRYKDSCRIDVRQSATSLKFKTSSLELEKNKTISNALSVSPSNVYSKTVTYTSSNKNVATVDSKGVVKGINAGTATITAATRYGVKKTASYKVTVYNVLNADNGTYALDRSTYNSYRITATKDTTETLILSNADIDNIFGKGNTGVDWTNTVDVEDNFAKASFSYTSGGNYIFKKVGNKVYTKLGNNEGTFVWNYDQTKSFERSGVNAYTITLYLGQETLKIKKTGDANSNRLVVSSTLSKKLIDVTQKMNTAKQIEMEIVAKDANPDREAKVTLTRINDKLYKVTMAPRYIERYDIKVCAYK